LDSTVYYDPAVTATLQSVFGLVVPEAILVAAACVLFLGATVRGGRGLWAGAALVALSLATAAFFANPGSTAQLLPTVCPIWPDGLTFFVRIASLVTAVVLVLLTWSEVSDAVAGEYYGCLLLITAGVNLTAASNELITLFLALELISIPTYVLLYLARNDRPAQEAAVKYFLLSVFSSGMVLFGFSYLAGQTGTTNIPALLDAYAGTGDGRLPVLALVAVVFIVCGLGFRITAVPFHFYAPDVYQGTSTGAAALLAVVPKLAGFAALVRLLGLVGPLRSEPALAIDYHVSLLFWILAAITMTLGNVIALWQDNLQRILAYSSIAHAGYMLVGLTTAPILFAQTGAPGGVPAVLFYLVAYGAMTLGAFGVIALLSSNNRRVENVDDLAGLSRTHPGIALVLSAFLFSLIGLPLTAGFAGKLMLFFGTLEVWQPLYVSLAVIMALNAAIGAYYYLRIVGVMYLRGALQPLDQPRSLAGRIAIGFCVALTIFFGVYPNPLLRLAQTAVSSSEVKVVQK
jgi:NADH-quinone oxidoreductase subunit N